MQLTTHQRMRPENHQKGVALAMILWFVAALSLLVAGIVSIAKTDVQQVQLQLQQAQAAAAGDGASLLAMRDLMILQEEGEFKGRGVFSADYTVGTLAVNIQAFSANGLVNLNRASAELLASVFEQGAGLGADQAEEIAENILEWRKASTLKDEEASAAYESVGRIGPRQGPFEVVEDVMQVLGVSRDMYERIGMSLTASSIGQPGIDPLSASVDVLTIVVGDGDVAQEIVATRQETPFEDHGVSADIPERYVSQGANSLFRLDANVVMEDGKIYQRRRWIQRSGGGRDRMPWNIIRSEPVKVVSSGG